MPSRYTRIAILAKQGLFAVIAGDFDVPNGDQPIHLTANFDPRSPEKPVFRSSHPTAADGRRYFEESVAVSRDRGWSVRYYGVRNYG